MGNCCGMGNKSAKDKAHKGKGNPQSSRDVATLVRSRELFPVYVPPPGYAMDKICARTIVKATEFTWTIDQFPAWVRKLENKGELSPTFKAEEHTWCLDLKKTTEHDKGFLGLYLYLRNTLSPKETVYAGFRFAIINNEGERTCETSMDYRTFSLPKAAGWGKSQFMRRDILINKDNGYLSKSTDSLTIVCEVHLFWTPEASTCGNGNTPAK